MKEPLLPESIIHINHYVLKIVRNLKKLIKS